MAQGRVSASYKQKGDAFVFLDRPAVVDRGSGHIAELSIIVEDSEIWAKLDREELTNLVLKAEEILQRKKVQP
jgi:hypothetical protein